MNGLLRDNDSEQNRTEIELFGEWCKENFLNLIIKKANKIVIDFKIKKDTVNPVINDEEVEMVKSYKYLIGTIIDSKLNGTENIRISKNDNWRLYFIRKVKK